MEPALILLFLLFIFRFLSKALKPFEKLVFGSIFAFLLVIFMWRSRRFRIPLISPRETLRPKYFHS
uniref:Putative ovule protein n=1 Tax=Solanum chacoense TaxID=4108 RepID=A0A0V0GXP8_SOLCH